MKATLEISYYPLADNYKEIIISFILELRKKYDFEIITSGLSTQIIAEYDVLMSVFNNEIKEYLSQTKSVMVFKLAIGEHNLENLAQELK